MGRKRKGFGWKSRALAAVGLAARLGGGWAWWHVTHWMPDATAYPDQGVLVGHAQGPVRFRTAGALGRD